jgi:hypothetical protein
MIATLNEIKTFLDITGSSQDSKIQLNMPIVENFICGFCKDDFVEYTNRVPSSPRILIQSAELAFVNSTNSLDSSTVDLSNYRLATGDNVKVYGSYHNDKVFTISSIASGSIVFDSVNTVKDEDYGENLIIVRIIYPEGLKKVYAFMINFNINKDNLKGLKSETILGYSYTLSSNNKSGYPDSAIGELFNYRKLIKRPLFNARSPGSFVIGGNYYGY